MIIAAAIRLSNGSVFVGKRHSDCFRNAVSVLNVASPDFFPGNGGEQGFITDRLVFLDREEAYYEAHHNNQCKEQKEITPNPTRSDFKWKPCLFSEDLW
jgi:hypothetical protein